MAITIESAANALKRYAIQYAPEISTALRQDMEWENAAKWRQTYDSYVAPTATVGELLQAYQCPITPKGSLAFDQVENRLQRIKWDLTITCDDLEVLYGSWRADWYEIHKDAADWSFPKYFVQQMVTPKWIEEQNWNYFNGSYVAPTLNTPGTSVGSMDGLKKKIAAWILAGNIVPIITGAITSSNIVEKVELMNTSLPPQLQKVKGKFYMSNTMANWFWADYRAKYGTGNGIIGNENNELKVDNSGKTIMGMASMEGSQRIIFCPDLIIGKRTNEPYMPAPVFRTDIRQITMSVVYHRFIGVEHFFNLFVNDQA